MIQILNLTRTYNNGNAFNAITNINLQIEKGDFVALTGPSGSGKSTLLNLIGGLDTPTSGQIIVNNQEISTYTDTELSAYRNQQIGFIFQEFHLEPFLNVEENILLPTYLNHQNKIAPHDATKKVLNLLTEVNLQNKSKSKIHELSGGQKQRIAIARALINNPQIILADEPTGNLDFQTGENIIKLLKNLHQKHQITLIIATHDQKIAQAANKVIEILDGKIKSIH